MENLQANPRPSPLYRAQCAFCQLSLKEQPSELIPQAPSNHLQPRVLCPELVEGCDDLADVLKNKHPSAVCSLQVLEQEVRQAQEGLPITSARNILLVLCLPHGRSKSSAGGAATVALMAFRTL